SVQMPRRRARAPLLPYTTLFRSEVAVAVTVDDVGDRRVLLDGGDQRRAAPGDQAVDHALELHELHRGLTADVVDHHEGVGRQPRSEEHTSALQSRENLVCRPLLE